MSGEKSDKYKRTKLPTSRGRGTGSAGPQAQRPLGGQGATRSGRPWGHHPAGHVLIL
jgi:hypothetical protein